LKEEKLTCDFEVENSGNNLSNGQKQIINFLRILINEHEIVCLDEATSNMDPTSDQLVHDKLFEFCQYKTLIVITHRLENIDKFDTIIVMD
jgi:ABC-type bacteriocin/lantibiotic exporter with double-glycine peptidase domain